MLGSFQCGWHQNKFVSLTVSEKSEGYAAHVEAKLKEVGAQVVWDNSSNKIGYKIREARNSSVPYRVVIGAKEQENGTVSVACRDNGDLGSMSLEDFIAKLMPEIAVKIIISFLAQKSHLDWMMSEWCLDFRLHRILLGGGYER